MANLEYVAEALRTRRRQLQPEDVGLARGRRRRTPGLRREEAAELCSISPGYYTRLERHRGAPHPSAATLAGIARGLRFTRAERDRLFAAAGYRGGEHLCAHVDPGVMLVLDRLAETPAHVVGPAGEVLRQTPASRALLGDLTVHTGWARSGYYRWFLEPGERQRYAAEEHPRIGAEIVAGLRRSVEQGHCGAELLATMLRQRSPEFTRLWADGAPPPATATTRRFLHPAVGVIDLRREVLEVDASGQRLVVYYPAPGSTDDTSVQLSTVIGHQRFP
ncbi:Helix-turn-helix domain-containing protein [Mycolicibacterium rutilum]|uniref:Helix-turn-helix domain-containing protein n=1 Tax=Mycolicibacterium rutilum TaxID=370526 RepID=A0A1H6JUR6_MYCRU|nr:helix-turn-helix transcriptional regulator [Mycolicibacterium rutilum]SEH66374.1 Helix-turn-helix domain-containing protein [Mycolicibacterium rutilum]